MTNTGAEKMSNDTIGVDVSKDRLDAHRLADGVIRVFVNDKAGLKAFLRWRAETQEARVDFEPTGPYHRTFEHALSSTVSRRSSIRWSSCRSALACGSRSGTRGQGSWLPGAIGSEQGVGADDELSHDGGDGDLGGLSGADELLVLGLQVRVEPHRHERGHVEASGASAATNQEPCRGSWRRSGP